MSRTLNNDFDDDDLLGGSLDLEKGSGQQLQTGAASSYGGEGMNFDDELYGDEAPAHGALELDLPKAPLPRTPAVPDLAFDATPRKPSGSHAAVRPSGSLPAVRPSGSLPAVRPSGSLPAVRPGAAHPAPPASSSAQSAASAPALQNSDSYAHGGPESGVRGAHDAAPESIREAEPAPPPKPTAAAVIAKYPDAPAKVIGAPMYAVRVVLRQLELRSDLESLRRRRSPDVPLYEGALRAYDARTFRLGMAMNSAAFAVLTFVFFLPVILRFMRAD